jgi:hypothetical protein
VLDRILYAETKKGGLSLPRPSLSAPCSRINVKRAILNSSDENIHSPLFTLSGIFILKCSASRAISSGRSVAIAKECIFSSDELRIALLTLILLQGAPLIAPADGTKYLGVMVNNWTGVPKKTQAKNLNSGVQE